MRGTENIEYRKYENTKMHKTRYRPTKAFKAHMGASSAQRDPLRPEGQRVCVRHGVGVRAVGRWASTAARSRGPFVARRGAFFSAGRGYVRVDGGDGAHALVDAANIAEIDTHVSTAQDVIQHLVHPLARALVGRTQYAEHLRRRDERFGGERAATASPALAQGACGRLRARARW